MIISDAAAVSVSVSTKGDAGVSQVVCVNHEFSACVCICCTCRFERPLPQAPLQRQILMLP